MTTETQEQPNQPRSTTWRIRTILLAILAVLSVIAAAFSSVSWALAAGNDGLDTARTREVVLRQAEQRLLEINTIDHKRAGECLDRWQQQVTGGLAKEVTANREGNIKAIRKSGTTTTARVLDAAVTKLDISNGDAQVIAALEITISTEKTEPTTKRSRISAELADTDKGWKLSGVQVVGLSG